MRILLIEDDRATALQMEMMLKSEGFNVYTTDLGEEGVDLAKIYDYDLIVLDLGLPDMLGHDVLRQIREARVQTPVLVCTGDGDIETKVRAFKGGADDYLTKPFHKDEFICRAHAIVRRSKGHAQAIIETGPIAINLDAKVCTVEGRPVHLTGKEYQMLELLSLRKGATLTKDMFLNHLYGGMDEPEIKIIDVFICKLRKKLRDASEDGSAGTHLETIWGRGYRLMDEPTKPLTAFERAEASEAEKNAGALMTIQGLALQRLAVATNRGLNVSTLASLLDTSCPAARGALELATRHQRVAYAMEGTGARRYIITETGLQWLADKGWSPAETARAA